jgi:hypothetical protein
VLKYLRAGERWFQPQSGKILLIPKVSWGGIVTIFSMRTISMSFSTHACCPPRKVALVRDARFAQSFPGEKIDFDDAGMKSRNLVMSMLNVHTTSNGALMMTCCLERNGVSWVS